MSEEASEPNKPVEKKKGKGKLVGILVALALILGAGAAGAVLAPKYLGGGKASAHKPAEATEEEGDGEAKGEDAEASGDEEKDAEEGDKKPSKASAGEVHEVQNLEAIVVDTRSADGNIRHVKVGLTIELVEGTKEAEFKSYVPRAREAAIGYFRTRDFEQLSDPKNFTQVVKDLNKEIIAAVGKKRAKRVVITDFVAQ
ncbi:MAG TPA: flagellar basal body-associated FliL family protein [Polyangiaceae bacterium]|nr:flagellar basal body-associated FliL family protein [Polyangiaceae bacterium]